MRLRVVLTLWGIGIIIGGILLSHSIFIRPIAGGNPEYLGMGMVIMGILIIGFSWANYRKATE